MCQIAAHRPRIVFGEKSAERLAVFTVPCSAAENKAAAGSVTRRRRLISFGAFNSGQNYPVMKKSRPFESEYETCSKLKRPRSPMLASCLPLPLTRPIIARSLRVCDCTESDRSDKRARDRRVRAHSTADDRRNENRAQWRRATETSRDAPIGPLVVILLFINFLACNRWLYCVRLGSCGPIQLQPLVTRGITRTVIAITNGGTMERQQS